VLAARLVAMAGEMHMCRVGRHLVVWVVVGVEVRVSQEGCLVHMPSLVH
jgi:hypothetical protein